MHGTRLNQQQHNTHVHSPVTESVFCGASHYYVILEAVVSQMEVLYPLGLSASSPTSPQSCYSVSCF